MVCMESAVIQMLADRAASCWMEVTVFRDHATKRVVYMEAGQDFVNLLLSFLVLPVASLVTRLAEQTRVPASLCAVSRILVCARLLDEHQFNREDFNNPEVSSLSVAEAVVDAAGLFEVAVQSDGVRDLQTLSAITRWCFQAWTKKHQGNPVTCDVCMSVQASVRHARKIVDQKRLTAAFRPASFSQRPFIVTDNLEIWPASGENLRKLFTRLEIRNPQCLEFYQVNVSPEQAQRLLEVAFTSHHALNDVFQC